jgi:mannitol-1-phosphate 5-dehydrogenase
MPRGQVVIFGAGAAGKGLVGILFSQAGYNLTFVDIKDELVETLQQARRYEVLVHRLDGRQETSVVEGFDVLHASDREAIAQRIAGADLVLTAVIAHNLPDVSETLALGVAACRRANRQHPLVCVACENMKKSSSTLAGYVRERLDEKETTYMDEVFHFPDSMINRVVPAPVNPLNVETEDYCEWTLDQQGLAECWPESVQFIERVDNQDARLDRKLMVYNGSHAACAYFGAQRGHAWIHEALADEVVVEQVGGFLKEVSSVVQRHHGFDEKSMEAYQDDFWLRCRNPGLKDQIFRVARQPGRKLGMHERLVAPARLAIQYDLPRSHILSAIIAALEYEHPEDEDALELSQSVKRRGLCRTLRQVAGLEENDPLLQEISDS